MAPRLLSRLVRRRGAAAPPREPSAPVPAPATDVPPTADEAEIDVASPARRTATRGQLRRERRTLLQRREERIHDLGGLLLEMFRQDRFRDDLLRAHCEELLGIERRIQELDAALEYVSSGRRRAAPPPLSDEICACGAPLAEGTNFCANCGRPVEGAAPVVACTNCGHALQADSNFCVVCGTPVELADTFEDLASSGLARSDRPTPPHERELERSNGVPGDPAHAEPVAAAADEPESRSDPWER